LTVAVTAVVLSSHALPQPPEKTMSDTIEGIAAVDPVHADTIRKRPTAFATEALAFYQRFKLLRITMSLARGPSAVKQEIAIKAPKRTS